MEHRTYSALLYYEDGLGEVGRCSNQMRNKFKKKQETMNSLLSFGPILLRC